MKKEQVMNTAPNRRFTSARTAALVLTVIVVAGLINLGISPDTGKVSVPEGASVGDLILEPCEYTGENGRYPADCGTFVVPETRGDPETRVIALPIIRVRATAEDEKEPVFFLTGGPGQSNMGFKMADRYTGDRDFVMVGYRGVDGSVRLDCPEVSSAMRHSTDILSEEFFRASGAGYRACADRLNEQGVDVASYGLVQQVDDLEAARVALGYDRINLLSESAGTRTAMIFAWRHPESILRSVMVGVNPPGNYLWDPQTTDEQIARYADVCAKDDICGSLTDDLVGSIDATRTEMPNRWLFLPIKDSNVHVVSMFGLFESTPSAWPSFAPSVIDVWLSAAEGDPSGMWVTSLIGDVMLPELFVYGQYAAAASVDAQAARDYFGPGAQDHEGNFGYDATAFGWAGGQAVETWPTANEVDDYTPVQESNVETLLIGGELDVSTPPQIATEELLPSLPNGHQVVLPGFGHTVTLFTEQPEASTRLINTFYDSGRVDDSLYAPHDVDFTLPPMTFGSVARIAVGALSALGALTVISLIVMARRFQRRGRTGPVAGALLRSIYPAFLGLGGWSLGVLIVLTTMPAVRIDNQVLIIVGVGLPIGLGIYWAWVNRDWPARVRAVGFGLALVGALVGAWLGYHALGGFPGILTAIVGATVGANISIIVFDIFGERSSPQVLDGESAAASGTPLEDVRT
jgi:pimeloyl-ACP methyl ester carboxylesterase